jgi:hypothetical protein
MAYPFKLPARRLREGGNKKYRRIYALPAQLLAQGETALAAQSHVDDQKIRVQLGHSPRDVVGGRRHIAYDKVRLVVDKGPQAGSEKPVVVDDQNASLPGGSRGEGLE